MSKYSSSNHLTISRYPFAAWGFSIVWFVFWILILLVSHSSSWAYSLVALSIIVFTTAVFGLAPSILSIKADKTTRVLSIKSGRPLFGLRVTEIPLDEVADCRLQTRETTYSDSDYDETGYHAANIVRYTVYRMVIVKTSGEIIPVIPEFALNPNQHTEKISRLVAFLGLPGEGPITSPFANLTQTRQTGGTQNTASYKSPIVTAGINWQIEKHEDPRASYVRWNSPDFSWPGRNLLVVAQLSAGMMTTELSRSTFDRTRKGLYHTIGFYGFSQEDAPGFADAEMLLPHPQLDAHFFCLSNAPDMAAKLLNTEITNTLLYWAQCHPATMTGYVAQMVVLFSPRGTDVCAFGKPNPSELDDLIALGVEIVRQAQQAVMPQL